MCNRVVLEHPRQPPPLLVRLARDERGSELVQFVLVLPILLALLWSSFEAWQMMSLKAAVRTTAAQAARYVTAFAGLPDTIPNRPDPLAIRLNVEQMVSAALSRHQGILGDALSWELRWYRILDPRNPRWENNVAELDPLNPFAGLQCNDQFAVLLHVTVPWRTVLFGIREPSTTNFVLELNETSVGSSPCMPYCDITAFVSNRVGCQADIQWSFQCSYEPDRVEVWIGGTKLNPDPDPNAPYVRITVPPGGSQVTVRAFGGQREAVAFLFVGCP